MKKRVVAEPVDPEAEAPVPGEVDVVRIIAPAPRQRGGDGYLLLGLLAGAVYGAVTGLLRAPRQGEATRRQLLGGADAEPARSQPPPGAEDAVAQVLQYSTPTAAESAGPGAATPPPSAPGL